MEDKLPPKEKANIDWVMSSEAGRRMMEKTAKSDRTKIAYARGCRFLSEYLKKPLDAVVQEYIADVKANHYAAADKWEQIFSDFAIWLGKQKIRGNKTLGSASVALYHAAAKSLINANVPRSMRLQTESPEVINRTIPGVTMEDLQEIYSMCDERERAFITILKDSGISADDALRLNYSDVEGFEKDEFVHINMYREKEHVEYETFIGPNAVAALRAYTTVRKNRGENITPQTAIFASDKTPYKCLNHAALAKTFQRIVKKTRKTISTHRLRKFFETYMALVVRHPIVLKYWMGHKVRRGRDIEARYIIPPTPEQLTLYRESYKNIDLIPRMTPEELSEARIKAELETMNPDARKQYLNTLIKRYTLKPNLKRLIEDIGKEFEDKEENNDCTDGVHCGEAFQQIKEGELLDYLRQGWQIVHRLNDGQVIVRR